MIDQGPFPTLEDVRLLVARALPESRVTGFEILSGGLINTNIKVNLDSHADVVLRLYRDGADVCRKEAALLRLVPDTVPVPELVYVEPDGFDRFGAFAVLAYVDGITFQELKRTNNLEAIQQASASVGQTLASIGRYQFSKPGRLLVDEPSGKLSVGEPYVAGPDSIPRILDTFLVSPNLRQRVSSELIDHLRNFARAWAACLPSLDNDRSLVHSDFGNRNILVREENGRWSVAAIVDWEFAFSGSPLLDVGHFLRYECCSQPLREPHFSRAFLEHGGRLPVDWRHLARVIDLTGLVECLTHDQLPIDIEVELLDLVHATLEDRDPS